MLAMPYRPVVTQSSLSVVEQSDVRYTATYCCQFVGPYIRGTLVKLSHGRSMYNIIPFAMIKIQETLESQGSSSP